MSDAITQDVYQEERTDNEDSTSSSQVWGTLFSYDKSYPMINLIDDHYSIGRLGKVVLPSSCAYYNSISKVHFEIKREGDKVILTDRSANGTFVEAARVGKNKSIELNNDDDIGLCCKKNKAFVFLNSSEKHTMYPVEVTNKYRISKKIGSGAYGEVKLAFIRGTTSKLAVKIIEKKTFFLTGKSTAHCIQTEVDILRQLSHPCIIKFMDAIDSGDKLYIFMELVEGGELFDRVITVKQFSDTEAKVLFYQMVLAIQYLHGQNICHRDLKPENILLSSDTDNCSLIKVTDFGLSKFLDGKTVLRTMCGTPNYLAPEVLLGGGQSSYTAACDVWSLGVILFVCLVGYPPFSDDNTDVSLRDQITGGQVAYPRCHWANVSPDAVDLVKRMLTVDPHDRITIEEIVAHRWLQDGPMRAIVDGLMHPRTTSDDHDNDDGGLTEEPIIKRQRLV